MTTIRSKNSSKTLAVARGTLVLRRRCIPDEDVMQATAAFEQQLDAGGLRRCGSATAKSNETVLELRCEAEYGPALGSYESDLLRALENILGDGQEGAVFHYTRREVTREELAATVADLTAKLDDLSLPLKVRKNLSATIDRLQPLALASAV